MSDKNKKPTTFEIADLIIKAVVALAALITAIKWWQDTQRRGESPSPKGHIYYITQRGALQVKKDNFWFITLCVLLIISLSAGMNLFLRIAIGANAIVILIDVFKDARRFYNGRKNTKD